MAFVIVGRFRSAVRVLRVQSIRGDGMTVESDRVMKWHDKTSAEAYAAAKRTEYPDTSYEVTTLENAKIYC